MFSSHKHKTCTRNNLGSVFFIIKRERKREKKKKENTKTNKKN